MTINIVHRGIDLTPAIKDYTEEKMQSLEKYMNIRHIDVDVGLNNGRHNKGKNFFCRAVVQVGSEVITMEREAEDLYKSIDKVRDHLREELTQWKKRLEERSQGKE